MASSGKAIGREDNRRHQRKQSSDTRGISSHRVARKPRANEIILMHLINSSCTYDVKIRYYYYLLRTQKVQLTGENQISEVKINEIIQFNSIFIHCINFASR